MAPAISSVRHQLPPLNLPTTIWCPCSSLHLPSPGLPPPYTTSRRRKAARRGRREGSSRPSAHRPPPVPCVSTHQDLICKK